MNFSPKSADYDRLYRRRQRRTILDEIEADVACDPEVTELNCTGFLTRKERDEILNLLEASLPDSRSRGTLLDVGCGTGLLGAWMATQLHVNLVGIDFSSVAISTARHLTASYDRINKAFTVTTFESTGLDDQSVTAAFSLDALYLAAEPINALKELHRVMEPGASLIFTYYLDSQNQRYWAKLVEDAGLRVVFLADLTSTWRHRMREKHLRRWESRQTIMKELGLSADSELSVTASMLGLRGRPSFIESTTRHLLRALRYL